MMEINYVDYSDDLFAAAVDNNRPKVYVFNNHDSRQEAQKYYRRPFLAQESSFLIMSELKEKLLPPDKLLLKEEKLVIIFYKLLTEEDKRQLKVSGYNDVIDLAGEFFNFYADLAEYKVDEIEGLTDWQQEKYDIFQKLRQRYIAKMDKLNYTDKTLNYQTTDLRLDYLQDFSEVVFVNILEFTPQEKEILSVLKREGKVLQLYNQLKPEDYDEEALQLKSVTLPDELNQQVEIYQIDEDLLQLATALSKAEEAEGKYTILDSDFENSNYHNLLGGSKIKVDKDINFTRTRLYRFLEALYTLLKNAEFRSGELRLRLGDVVEASYLAGFRDYYGLGRSELNGIEKLAQNDYVYFCEKLIDDQLAPFRAVLEEIKKLSRLRTLSKFCNYLEDIGVESLNDSKYKNDIQTFFSALAELHSIEEMGIVDSWNQYFTTNTQGLFLLILNYLKFKQVEKAAGNEEAELEVKDLLSSSSACRENIMMLNVAEGIVPQSQEATFLLTEEQRAQLGLKTYCQRRLEMKYKFFRHLLSSGKTVIFSLKKEAENVAVSSFVEELKLKYNLPTKESEITGGDYPEFIKNIFDCDCDLLGAALNSGDDYADRLKIEPEDFSSQKLSLTYYKYSILKQYCSYRFYLEDIAELESEQVEFSKTISAKVLGTIVHRALEKIINKLGDEIKASSFEPETEVVKDILADKMASFDLKIPGYYEQYYEEIIFKSVRKSIEYFLIEISDRIEGSIEKIVTEWMPDKDELGVFIAGTDIDIHLNGRIDLVIETDESKYIIDYKTGSGDDEQLDLYSLLYKPDFAAEETINKSIYNVMEEKFEWGSRNSEQRFAEKLQQLLEEQFIEREEYKGEFKSRCKRCHYLDVCKVGLR